MARLQHSPTTGRAKGCDADPRPHHANAIATAPNLPGERDPSSDRVMLVALAVGGQGPTPTTWDGLLLGRWPVSSCFIFLPPMRTVLPGSAKQTEFRQIGSRFFIIGRVPRIFPSHLSPGFAPRRRGPFPDVPASEGGPLRWPAFPDELPGRPCSPQLSRKATVRASVAAISRGRGVASLEPFRGNANVKAGKIGGSAPPAEGVTSADRRRGRAMTVPARAGLARCGGRAPPPQMARGYWRDPGPGRPQPNFSIAPDGNAPVSGSSGPPSAPDRQRRDLSSSPRPGRRSGCGPSKILGQRVDNHSPSPRAAALSQLPGMESFLRQSPYVAAQTATATGGVSSRR